MDRAHPAQVRKMRFEQRTDHLEQLFESRLFVQRNVVDLVDGGRVVGHGGEQICLDRVVDIAEIAGRFPVAIDEDRFLADHAGNPFRDHRGVRPVRILARTEHVEVAQPDRAESIAARKNLRVKLVHVFGQCGG